MHNQAVVPERLLTDSAVAVVGSSLEVAVAVLGMTLQTVAAGPGGTHQEDNSAEVQSAAVVNILHYHVSNTTSYHTS